MKKLIALFATTAVASGSAMGAIALSGSALISDIIKGLLTWQMAI